MRTGIQSSHQNQQLCFRSLCSSSAFYLPFVSVQSLPTPCAILNHGRIMYFDAATTPAHVTVPSLRSSLESVLKHHPEGTQHRSAASGSTARWRNWYPTSTPAKGSGCPAGWWQQEGPCAPTQPGATGALALFSGSAVAPGLEHPPTPALCWVNTSAGARGLLKVSLSEKMILKIKKVLPPAAIWWACFVVVWAWVFLFVCF